MKLITLLVALLSSLIAIDAKAVFAHFMVGNTAEFSVDDWKSNIALAQKAGIDAFALNMASNEATTTSSMPLAFTAAEDLGFKLFFSFDYAGNGAWDKATVKSLISAHASSSAYYHRGSQPLVSTFEGPGSAGDWAEIKSATGCFFIPDWSSLGARDAALLANGIADGLFSWDAWPKGPVDTNTYPDASYKEFLKGKPYMAAASPWFYTNLPGFDKNWLWRGDSLWFDRWQQLVALDFQPEFIQIISWNDFGESHYIGPLDNRQYSAFEIGYAPFNFVDGYPHDGWRDFLPFWIALWKNGVATVNQEGLTAWYRLNPKSACSDGGTTGNTASQLLLEYAPADVIQDKIFFTALLGSDAIPSVSLNGAALSTQWTSKPYGGVGVYYGSANTNGGTGNVVVTITRNGIQVAQLSGQAISGSCTFGLNNYNAWVGTSWGGGISATTPKSISSLNCTQGSGYGNFKGLCDFDCSNGYCPSGACYCTGLGIANPPPIVDKPGFPLAGASPSYEGICSFACNHNYCPDTACGPTKQPEVLPTTGEFTAPTCTGGAGPSPFQGLCDYACHFGYCPRGLCSCLATGPLNVPPAPNTNIKGSATDGYADYGICNFACQRGYCPYPCTNSTGTPTGSPPSTTTVPGGGFVQLPGPGFDSHRWPLLYNTDSYSHVHLDRETANYVRAFLDPSCSVQSRKARDGTHQHEARSALTDCLLAAFQHLSQSTTILNNLVQLYRGGTSAGTAKSLTDLPRYADDSQQAIVNQALLFGVTQLERLEDVLEASEMIFIIYALMDIVFAHSFSSLQGPYNFVIPSSGRMTATCPAQSDVQCSHTLCQGENAIAVCSGFFWGCACNKGNQCPDDTTDDFPIVCNECGGTDEGLCPSGDHSGCPCIAEYNFEPLAWYDDPEVWDIIDKYYMDIFGK